jgi:hypothetical protein
MYAANNQENVTILPQQTYDIPFKPSPHANAEYPDIKINYRFRESRLPLRVLITKDPDDGCNAEYGIVRPSKLDVNLYASTGSKIWIFTTNINQR